MADIPALDFPIRWRADHKPTVLFALFTANYALLSVLRGDWYHEIEQNPNANAHVISHLKEASAHLQAAHIALDSGGD